jgi:hypothetical protein
MKRFFSEHSYDMVKMLLNQIVISIFGFSLVLATMKAENVTLRNLSSVFSILFYLFLLYMMTWEIGYKDKIAVEQGRKARNPFRGLLISLCANSVNFLCAIFITLKAFLPNAGALTSIGDVCQALTVFLQGMYTGVLTNAVGGVILNKYWFVYFLTPLPAMLICALAYQLGVHDVKHSAFFQKNQYPESDRETKKKG